MLYLARKVGESIIIDNDIEVKIIEIKGKTARIGINSVRSTSVFRKEVHEKIVEENMEAKEIAHSSIEILRKLETNNDSE
jgi:carbon storage regulator